MVADINESGGRNTEKAMPENIRFHRTDITQKRDWDTLIATTQDVFGGVDCLVNNAGTTYPNKVCWPPMMNVLLPS